VYHPTLGLRVIKKKKKFGVKGLGVGVEGYGCSIVLADPDDCGKCAVVLGLLLLFFITLKPRVE